MARANPRSVRQRIFQSYPLVWVDPSIDESNSACQHTLQQLRTVANDITIFTDVDRCVAFLENVYNEKVIVITSEELGQNLVPCIHSMAQVHTIYIFCNNRVLHEAWTEGWSKIKGVCTRIEPICEVLQYLTGQHNEDSTLISFVPLDLTTFATNLDQLEPSFMYTQLFKSAFLEMEHDKNEHKDLVVYCREQKAGLSAELSVVDEFEHKYSPDKAIWWYTRECFIYPTLNRALRLLESDVIVEMGFFVHDLHQQIEQLHREQMEQYRGQSFELYRGQGLSTTDFDKLKHTLGGLLSFNNFLSTTRDRALAEARAESSSHATETFGIVFVMTIDSALASTPFASISEHSYFEDTEMEVLFSMHSVFRIDQVKDLNGNGRLFEVQLTLSADDDPQLRLVREKMHEETKGATGWSVIGVLLIKVGELKKAEQLYKSLLSQLGNQTDSAPYNHQLGLIKYYQGEYRDALSYFEKCLDTMREAIPDNDPSLATSYNNIGLVYKNLGEYSEALIYYEKCLDIRQKTLSVNHPHVATSYNNIGSLHDTMGEYSKALISHRKCLNIMQKTLPINHPDVASCYNNIGSVYKNLGEYSEALIYYEKCLDIRQRTLPANHPSLATSYNNIGSLHDTMGEYSKALLYHEKCLDTIRKTLPNNHPDFSTSYNNIGLLCTSLGQYSERKGLANRKCLSVQPISEQHFKMSAGLQISMQN